MNSLIVHEPGLLTTVQDLGRDGFGPLGVSPSGAADSLSLRMGNLLVGNREDAAALEMTLVGGVFTFTNDALVGLAGSDFAASLDGAPLAMWESRTIPAGVSLQFSATRSGARCYLCVKGGIDIPLFLGSASTHLLSGMGGFHGRALRRGDALDISEAGASSGKRRLNPAITDALRPRKTLRVTPGPQADWFPESARGALCENTYRVAETSNRMGLRLEGTRIEPAQREMITEGVALGAIQVPPDGRPIVLFVEQQTTGGYPKIANVIAADLHSVGQLRPRDEIRFELVDLATAQSLLREQEHLLQSEAVIPA
jgi:antagonist of KipI